MTRSGNIAVLDIGKTNVKLEIFDHRGRVLWQISRSNAPLQTGPYPHADIEVIWNFLLTSLKLASSLLEIDTLVPTTHGATGALIDENSLVLPVMDYEFDHLDEIEPRYAPLRPSFSQTFSPKLPNGLNLGRQFAWQAWHHPQDFARATHVLTYPQYWLWRLTGALASDVTSLGCHTDLWLPEQNRPSRLAEALDITRRLPPLHPSWTKMGKIKPEIAARTGLSADVQVLCGIHDSNAALLPYLLARATPFTVLSTGTWVVFMAVGHPLENLRAEDDMMANVDATGTPTACARFMGGREYAEITGDCAAPPALAEVEQLVASGCFALPSFSPHGGPYAAHEGRFLGPIQPEKRASLASLYCALMSDHILQRLGVTTGDIIIDGSFARNAVFCAILAQLRPAQRVICAKDQAGTARGAALLADWPNMAMAAETTEIQASTLSGLDRYRARWLSEISGF